MRADTGFTVLRTSNGVMKSSEPALLTVRGQFEMLGRMSWQDEIVPITRHMLVSDVPRMHAISVPADSRAAALIRQSRSFVVNLVPEDVLLNELRTTECEQLLDAFRIEQAVSWLECDLMSEYEMGDHVLFIGRARHYPSKD